MDEIAQQKFLDAVIAARCEHMSLSGLIKDLRPASESEGYYLQDALPARLQGNGFGPRVGHKIGCTTQVMQEYMKVPHPCAGGVYESTVRFMNGTFRLSDFVRVGVECEIAVRLAEDLTSRGAKFSRRDVAQAIASCMVAIEVVDDRYADFRSLGAPALIADDFFGAGCVLGAEVADFDPFDLGGVSASMVIDGAEVGTGVGSDVLGHPLDALVWLANNAAHRECRGLRAGEFVLLGSLVQTKWLDGPCEIRAINDPLGEITARFER
ncbi:fumarylacetoacetate hydrolase family protein [Streptomyces sp. NPDC050619]|uniref:2-keto-4-pentenoate hydratase n=1 Tax=Streptomyces sp. NPDC050619 TaxID=3157214 RepID=UPI0034454A6F